MSSPRSVVEEPIRKVCAAKRLHFVGGNSCSGHVELTKRCRRVNIRGLLHAGEESWRTTRAQFRIGTPTTMKNECSDDNAAVAITGATATIVEPDRSGNDRGCRRSVSVLFAYSIYNSTQINAHVDDRVGEYVETHGTPGPQGEPGERGPAGGAAVRVAFQAGTRLTWDPTQRNALSSRALNIRQVTRFVANRASVSFAGSRYLVS